jgi:hypothetical protein
MRGARYLDQGSPPPLRKQLAAKQFDFVHAVARRDRSCCRTLALTRVLSAARTSAAGERELSLALARVVSTAGRWAAGLRMRLDRSARVEGTALAAPVTLPHTIASGDADDCLFDTPHDVLGPTPAHVVGNWGLELTSTHLFVSSSPPPNDALGTTAQHVQGCFATAAMAAVATALPRHFGRIRTAHGVADRPRRLADDRAPLGGVGGFNRDNRDRRRTSFGA